ncbi:MAG: rimM [Rickettsiaceae bacterium]|jgi:16S rRNA processing protein RimM|nr:rimM [Rickettsiaceae bacterium]
MQKQEKLICVGQITSAHGILGQLKLRSFTDPNTKMFSYKKHYDENGNLIFIKKLKHDKNIFICEIKDINTRDLAESLKGKKIFVTRNEFIDLKEDEFYISDLEGSKLYDFETDELIGTVFSVLNFGAGDIIEVELSNKEKILVPFNKDFFPKMDLVNERIYINIPNYV